MVWLLQNHHAFWDSTFPAVLQTRHKVMQAVRVLCFQRSFLRSRTSVVQMARSYSQRSATADRKLSSTLMTKQFKVHTCASRCFQSRGLFILSCPAPPMLHTLLLQLHLPPATTQGQSRLPTDCNRSHELVGCHQAVLAELDHADCLRSGEYATFQLRAGSRM